MVRRAVCLLVMASLAGCQREAESPTGEAPATREVRAPASAVVLTSAPFQQSAVTLVSRGKQVTANTFERLKATVALREERIESLQLTVHLDSVVGSDKAALARLKSREAFDAAARPVATFRSTQVVAGSAPNTLVVTGELELLGGKHTVSFPVRVSASARQVELDAELELTREHWLNAVGDKATPLFNEGLMLAARLTFPRADASAPAAARDEAKETTR